MIVHEKNPKNDHTNLLNKLLSITGRVNGWCNDKVVEQKKKKKKKKKKKSVNFVKFSVLKLHYNNGQGHLLSIKHGFVNLKLFL